ncbi:MAG TPA: DUF4230 domain-containing protein [Rugosibacter sp.]|nr:DUF4230 domain-containing protein [Rugosibacter sp.]HQN46005.1 DUF4230 domain-containing protein [Rugosibacter sp.]
MDINLKHTAFTLAAVAGVSFFVGYQVAPRELLDSTVEHVGFLTVDTKKVLSATIESLKSESRLVSYAYGGTQNVSVDRDKWIIFSGYQQLIVPATVSYFIDLSKLTETSATFDESTNTVTVTLPRLMLTVEFDPRRATIINDGLLTLNDEVVQTLTKINYGTALKAAIKQGQQAALVQSARDRTKENIERLFRVPLQAAGKAGVKVVVSFAN